MSKAQPVATGRETPFAAWCRSQEVDPKQARSRLRRAGYTRRGGNYPLNSKTKRLALGQQAA